MGKKSNITHQCLKELNKQKKFGESKFEAKQAARKAGENSATVRGIYSTVTFYSYVRVCKQFIAETIASHKEVKTFKDCKKYVPEFLQDKEDKGLSAWTLAQYGSALASAYNCRKNDFGYDYPVRHRADIKRCRGVSSSDYRHPEERWDTAKMVLKATGCRRTEALRLRKEDFREAPDGNLEVFKRGKGGIERWCLVNPKYAEELREYLKTAETYPVSGENRLFLKAQLPSGSIHDMRADYARDLYQYFEDRGDVATGKIYHCKGDMLGRSFDKGILSAVSYNLQHSRDNVVVNHYLWK